MKAALLSQLQETQKDRALQALNTCCIDLPAVLHKSSIIELAYARLSSSVVHCMHLPWLHAPCSAACHLSGRFNSRKTTVWLFNACCSTQPACPAASKRVNTF
jgi:hypothetical protein